MPASRKNPPFSLRLLGFCVKRLVHYFPLTVYFEQRHVIDEFYAGIIKYDSCHGCVPANVDGLYLPAFFAFLFIRRRLSSKCPLDKGIERLARVFSVADPYHIAFGMKCFSGQLRI